MTSKAAVALLARIAEISSEQDEGRSFIATSRLSTPVTSEHIEVLSQPDGAFVSAAALAAAVELSKLVDCVQDVAPTFNHPASVGASFVTNVYKQAVSDIEFALAPLTAEQKADFERAETILYVDAPFVRTEAYTQFAELRAEVASQEIDRAQTLRALQQANEAEKEVITGRLETIDATLAANRELLSALDAQHGISAAIDIYKGATVAGFPPKFERAHALLGDPVFEITDPNSNETHWPAEFFPNQLTEENWITIKLTRADIANIDTSAAETLPDLPQAAQKLALNDEALDLLELEVQILRVDRPWMWSGIFENHQWRFRPGVEPLSNGKPDATGQLPAFVTGLIFARNLRLSGRKNMVSNTGALKFKTIKSVAAAKLIAPKLNPLATAVVAKSAPLKPTATVVLPNPTFKIKRQMLANPFITAQRVLVNGKMVDKNNKPVDSVTVTLTHAKTGVKLKGESDTKGNVVFRLAGEGTYEIVASKKNFRTFKTRKLLKSGGGFKAVLEPQFASNLVAANVIKIAAAVGSPLAVELRKRDDNGLLKPLDVPAEVVAVNQSTNKRHHQTVKPGETAIFMNLATGKYNVSVHCAVYEPEGTTSRQVDVPNASTVEFTFRPRTILQSEDTFLFGFLCYRTPRSPSPGKFVDFGD